MCKAQAIIDELVSIGQGNRKDSGSTKECKWGTSVGMFYTFVVDVLDPYLCFRLAHGNGLKKIAMDNVMMM